MSEADQKKYDWGHLWPQSLPKYIPNGFRIKQDAPPYEEKPVVDKLYEPYLTKAIPQYWVTLEDAPTFAELSTSIKDYLSQKKAEWISGQVDIDADWDVYLAQLDKLNVNKLIEIRKNAL